MATCLILGGSGYIGTHLARHFLSENIFSTIYIADIAESPFKKHENVIFFYADVRNPIPKNHIHHPIDWIFNLAAVHREPGHASSEYFVTNTLGAQNTVTLASLIGCKNVFFFSSISTYGPTNIPTDENTLLAPDTPYGISKMQAEYIHKLWHASTPGSRLIIVRPAVIYGPGDPGNILRMINAIKKGYFFLPGSGHIKKSFGYVYGLCESVLFCINSDESLITYNYAEKHTLTLFELVTAIKKQTKSKTIVIQLPKILLLTLAKIVHLLKPGFAGIHPLRVQKVTRPTHILPTYLMQKGFEFKYDFETSLKHWKSLSPNDF